MKLIKEIERMHTSFLDKFNPIFLCIGVRLWSFGVSSLPMMSKRRKAQSKLQKSFALSFDLNIDDSRFETVVFDISDIDSVFTSCNIAFNGELCILCALRKES